MLFQKVINKTLPILSGIKLWYFDTNTFSQNEKLDAYFLFAQLHCSLFQASLKDVTFAISLRCLWGLGSVWTDEVCRLQSRQAANIWKW